ncbi:MAG: 50S ribosomal protein L4 [Thermoleophilaceae bacterium]
MSPTPSVKAPLLDASGKKAKDVALEPAVFAAELKPHLVHETVRAELAAARQGTRNAKTRGQVSGGRSKPWRQKGTGRARQGTTRAPQWTHGGVAFPTGGRNFHLKVNRRARKQALAGALSDHVRRGSLALVDGSAFDVPSTRKAVELLTAWGQEQPLLVVAQPEEEALLKSFRNLQRTVVTVPAELEVAGIAWARSVLVSQAALEWVQAKAVDGRGKSDGKAGA